MVEAYSFGKSYLQGLLGIRVRRIRRTIRFVDLRTYIQRTELTVVNVGDTAAKIVPSEVFPRENLVQFTSHDSTGTLLTSVPSFYRRRLFVALAYYRVIQTHLRHIMDPNFDENLLDKCMKILKALPLLFDCSQTTSGRDKVDQHINLIGKLIDDAMSERENGRRPDRHFGHNDLVAIASQSSLDGPLSLELFDKQCHECDNIEGFFKTSIKDVASIDTSANHHLSDISGLTIERILGIEITENVARLNRTLMPLLFLKNPMEPWEIRTIVTETTRFVPDSGIIRHRWLDQTLHLFLPLYLPIYGRRYACHLHIIPPQELNFRYYTLLPLGPHRDHIWVEPTTGRWFKESSFCIGHNGDWDIPRGTEIEGCSEFFKAAGLYELTGSHTEPRDTQDSTAPHDQSGNQQSFTAPLNETRARLEGTIAALYFGPLFPKRLTSKDHDGPTESERSKYAECSKFHILRIRLTTRWTSLVLPIWHASYWAALSYLALVSLIIGQDLEIYNLLLIVGVGQTVATYLHVMQKPKAVQALLKRHLIVSLGTMCFSLLLFITWIASPVIMYMAHHYALDGFNVLAIHVLVGAGVLTALLTAITYVKVKMHRLCSDVSTFWENLRR